MVEITPPYSPALLSAAQTDRVDGISPKNGRTSFLGNRRRVLLIAACMTAILAVTTVVAVRHGASSVVSSTPVAVRPTPKATTGAALGTTTTPPTSVSLPAISAGSTPTTPATTVTPAAAVAPSTTPVARSVPVVAAAQPVVAAAQPVAVAPPLATLVAEVEAAGIEPGSNWSWSMGDTAAHCGPISGSGTGCTYGAGGLEYTVFAGSPNLSLVAHELANAETQNDAVPNLLSEVAAAEGGTSWSPTDAVASCLVVHFLGFQDDAAGTWQCPVAVASFVASNIHDTLSTVVGPIPG
jgi:hypothetical protein